MPRQFSSGIAGELTRSGSYPGWLLQITIASGVVLYMTTLDVDFDYNGNSYVSADIDITDLAFDGTVSRGAAVEFGDMTLAVWVATLYRNFDDATVAILYCYADIPGEATEVGTYRFGKPQRKVGGDGESVAFALDAVATTLFAPRKRMQDVIDQFWMLPAGSVLMVNGQKWVIDRPKTANT